MQITKHREADGWRVHVDGRRTPIWFGRSVARKQWGNPQAWDVLYDREGGDPDHLFEAKGASEAMATITKLATVFAALAEPFTGLADTSAEPGRPVYVGDISTVSGPLVTKATTSSA